MASAASNPNSPAALLSAMLDVTEQKIVPLTRAGVSSGSKLFGAAVLSRDGLSPLTVATNDERVSPLLHGEINCIQQFFASRPPETRPATADCVFFATHEPCSLCLSGIAWSGFNEFYYLFAYEDSRDLFGIPYDIEILQEVFRVPAPTDTPETLAARPLYNRTNKFFRGRSLSDLVSEIEGEVERRAWKERIEQVKGLYSSLSATYQAGKEAGTDSASVWK
ncbi:hypothetical protein MAPG_01057 [Magnaporthiopsis poae ATCC 64411]|uniref:CMP/dCMP-type deaminase domain-containing protein n=1 Tax=Magnaporthiopsis poae (strain ATCC 64411 / 73-15) TaxID=644358 RepID=A0A0C4DMP6_MAGP6|nr:hypothetical protein MAPG_01057 [Magnaporthiopsis poae ATCC 64411]